MGEDPSGIRWDSAWRRQRSVLLRETAGIDRVQEPVEIRMDFSDETVRELPRELRVIRADGRGPAATFEEVPSQIYDHSSYHRGQGGTVAFLATVPAGGQAVYLVCHDNPDASTPEYGTDLRVTEPDSGLGFVIDTDHFHGELDGASGQLRLLTPTQIGGPPLETRERPVNVTPDIVAKENLAYVNVKRWNPPTIVRIDRGPVLFAIHRSATMDFPGPNGEPGLPQVEIGVTYRFFAGQPYFVQTSTIRFTDDMEVYSMRNGAEMAWKDNPFTHAVWEDEDGRTMGVALDSMNPLTVEDRDQGGRGDISAHVPWVGFVNPDTGAGVVALLLDYRNISPYTTGGRAPTHNERIYVFAGPGDNYWFRGPIWEHSLQDPERCAATLIPAGSIYMESNAVLAFRYEADTAVRPVQIWNQRLRHPLVATYQEDDARARRWQPAEPAPGSPFPEILAAAGSSEV